jgi:hypothetical protein
MITLEAIAKHKKENYEADTGFLGLALSVLMHSSSRRNFQVQLKPDPQEDQF